MSDLLLEIGLEEVPARMLPAAQAELLKRTLALLTREHLLDADTTSASYSTPRRLAVLVKGVRQQQEDITEEATGPAVKIAFKDGVPTPAAEAFARKAGVSVDALKTISTPKGDYLAATTVKKGRTAAEVIATELPKEIAGIYWAKNMRWIPGSNERFVRPVLWLVCLLDEAIIPLTFAGKTAGRATYGHRVLSSGDPFEIQAPSSYLAQLEGEYVLADVELRRQKIRKALDHVTRSIPNARWRENEALVDAVTHLTEWPDVLLGTFEPAFLALPEEVLVTVMRDHQKYFAIEDASGKLAPHFLTVTNIALADENSAIIRQGNERVLRARFNDARFFWEFDQRTPLADRVKLLKNVTFQKDLGSYAWKTEVNMDLAQTLAEFAGADDQIVKRSAELAKADLTTELVKEFTELQGKIGAFYLLNEGLEDSRVADAIYWQYTPSSPDEKIPQSKEAQVLGLADRFTTILHMFRIGIVPTGSKDPFALRRAGNGVIKLLAESNLPLTLFHLFDCSDSGNMGALQESVWKFLNERVEFYLREGRRFPNGVIRAVMMALGSPIARFENVAALSIVTWGEDKLVNDVKDAVLRAEALEEVSGSQDFADVANAFKRTKKIVAQADQKFEPFAAEISQERLIEAVERALYERASNVAVEVENYRKLRTREGYVQALRLIATLRPQVDAFFDTKSGVMVMSEDAELRANRLALMRWLLDTFSRIADFSEIVIAG
ncbi:MAG: glycine--tRNA ligase subunit beta [Acidobacteriaceae bacterium]